MKVRIQLAGLFMAGLMFPLWVGCESLPTSIPDGGLLPLTIDRVEPDTVLPGTWVMVHGAGFTPPATGSLSLELVQDNQTQAFAWERVDENLLAFRVDRALFNALGGPGVCQGHLKAGVEDYAIGASLYANSRSNGP